MADVSINTIDEIGELNVLNDRVGTLKRICDEAEVKISGLRSYSYMTSWKETESDPFHLRRAKGFAKILEDAAAVIRPGELIVGSETKYVKGAESSEDYCPYDMLEGLKSGSFETLSEVMFASIDDEQKELLTEAANFWVGKSVQDHIHAAWNRELGDEFWELADADTRVIETVLNFATKGASLFNPKVLSIGLNGIIEDAKREKEEMTRTTGHSVGIDQQRFHKLTILNCIIITCEAVIKFANKHAAVARNLAKKESDPQRKAELLIIAEHCNHVPANPARNFAEAVQSVWTIHLALKKEEPVPGGPCLGRMDQYLYPFYKQGIEDGTLTNQDAAELLGCLWVKVNELTGARAKVSNQESAASLLQQVTLSGETIEGKDATNELSFIILEVARQMKTPQPGIYIRWHHKINHQFMIKAVETNRDVGGGIPAFLGEQSAISRAMAMGVSREDAQEWSGAACLYYVLGHCNTSPQVLGNLNFVKIFEVTLNNGVDPRTGKKVGPETGDPRTFTGLEELNKAWETQYLYFLDKLIYVGYLGHSAKMERYSIPLTTALLDDSVKLGLDAAEGGERYPQISILYGDRGQVDVADCLTAIQKLVFEEKKITMSELLDALADNFEGHEGVQKMCLSAPKYGNDDDYADDIFNYVSLRTCDMMTSRKNPWTNKPVCWQRPAVSGHYYHGTVIGALPNGRKAGLPIADANLSAMGGADVNGPTALINSATKINHFPPELNGAVFNLKFTPTMLKSKTDIEKFISLVKTFFNRGGWHIQFNILDKFQLVEAQKKPQDYRNLVTRVAGYSAYFVELPLNVQNEIIDRTELQL